MPQKSRGVAQLVLLVIFAVLLLEFANNVIWKSNANNNPQSSESSTTSTPRHSKSVQQPSTTKEETEDATPPSIPRPRPPTLRKANDLPVEASDHASALVAGHAPTVDAEQDTVDHSVGRHGHPTPSTVELSSSSAPAVGEETGSNQGQHEDAVFGESRYKPQQLVQVSAGIHEIKTTIAEVNHEGAGVGTAVDEESVAKEQLPSHSKPKPNKEESPLDHLLFIPSGLATLSKQDLLKHRISMEREYQKHVHEQQQQQQGDTGRAGPVMSPQRGRGSSDDLDDHKTLNHAAQHPKLRNAGGHSTADDEVLLLPLIVFLHGAGEIGEDLMKLVRSQPADGTIPQILADKNMDVKWASDHPLFNHVDHQQQDGREDERSASNTKPAFPAIVLMPQSHTSWRVEDAINAAKRLVTTTLDTVYEVHHNHEKLWRVTDHRQPQGPDKKSSITWVGIDHRRVYITGVSNGGHGAYRLHLAMPKVFAGVIPVCGFLAGGDDAAPMKEAAAPLCKTLAHGQLMQPAAHGWAEFSGREEDDRQHRVSDGGGLLRYCDTSLFLVHGPNDQIVPVDASDAVSESCVAVGVPHQCVQYVREETPDAADGTVNGHAAWKPAYAKDSKLWYWLHQVRRP